MTVSPAAALRDVDLEAVLAGQRTGPHHLLALGLCTAVMTVDGFDVFVIGKLAPAIADTFGRPVAAMTPVFVAQQAGLAAGAFVIGPLADRFGRRRLLIGCTALFALFTLLSLLATSTAAFAACRLAAGLFLSGVIPNVVALMSEVAPAAARARFVTIAFCGYSAGNVLAAVYVAAWLDRFGWQGGFVVGGLLPLLLLPLLWRLLPESAQFLATRDARDPRIGRTLARFAPRFSATPNDRYGTGRAVAKPRLGDIVRGRLAGTTGLLWLSYAFALGNVALLASWSATFFNVLGGVPLRDFAAASVLGFAGGLLGMLAVGWLMDRLGGMAVVAAVFAANGLLTIAAGVLPFGTPLFLAVLLGWYCCQSGGQAGLNALAAACYRPAIRSTGVGCAFGAGRLGGVVAPLLGGLALSSQLSLQLTMALVAIPSFCVAALVIVLGRVAPPMDRDAE